MSDTTQGQDAPTEGAALFREAMDAPTLDQFENQGQLPEPPEQPQQPQQPQPEPQQPEGAVPPGRFREENELRRRFEQEATELRARLAAYEVQPRQPQQPQPGPDVFDNPKAYVESIVKPYLEQLDARAQRDREQRSIEDSVRVYGEQPVSAAYEAVRQGMWRGDEQVKAVYDRAMASHNPYGVITRWHMEREMLQQIGGDLNTFKANYQKELLKDPEHLKQALLAARGSATSQINQPAVIQSKSLTLPSLSDIGATGGDEQIMEASDEALFRQAVSAKKRRG